MDVSICARLKGSRLSCLNGQSWILICAYINMASGVDSSDVDKALWTMCKAHLQLSKIVKLLVFSLDI